MTSPNYRRAAVAFVVYMVFVILWGAVVRATSSGAGCGEHWPLCDGEVVPTAPSITKLIEYTHRLSSGLVLVFAIAFAWLGRTKAAGVRKSANAVLFFTITESLVGAGLVLTRMVADNPDAFRGFWVAGHLINTFLLVAATALHAHFAYDGGFAPLHGKMRSLFVVLTLLFLVVGVSGAIAALGDTLFPVGSFAEGLAQDLDPNAHIFLKLRVWHPLLATILAAALFAFGAHRFALLNKGRVRSLAGTMAALALVQVALGLLNLQLLAPVWLQVVHLLVADALWIVFVLVAVQIGASTNAISSTTVST